MIGAGQISVLPPAIRKYELAMSARDGAVGDNDVATRVASDAPDPARRKANLAILERGDEFWSLAQLASLPGGHFVWASRLEGGGRIPL